MIAILASILRLNRASSGFESEQSHDEGTHWQQQRRDDALGEYLRGAGQAEVTPEVLLRIL